MSIRVALSLVCMFLLSGCFMTQKQPQSTAPKIPYVEGQVVVEDLQINDQGSLANVSAAFGIRTTKPTEPVNAVSRRFNLGTAAIETRSPKCESGVAPVKKSARGATATDVGRVLFGPANQKSVLELEQSPQHLYSSNLAPDLPAYLYQIVVEGAGNIPGFRAAVSVPEEVYWLRVGGINWGQPNMELRKGDPLFVEWKNPTVAHDSNVILMDLVAKNETEIFSLSCGSLEADLPMASGMTSWKIEASVLDRIPQDAEVTLSFMRAHLVRAKSENLDIAMQGVRSFFAVVKYEPAL